MPPRSCLKRARVIPRTGELLPRTRPVSADLRSIRSAVLRRSGRRIRFSALVRLPRSMATIRAGCDMDEVTELDRFEPVPDTAWHDVGIT